MEYHVCWGCFFYLEGAHDVGIQVVPVVECVVGLPFRPEVVDGVLEIP